MIQVSGSVIVKTANVEGTLSAMAIGASAKAVHPVVMSSATKVDCHWVGARSTSIGRNVTAVLTLVTILKTDKFLKVDKDVIWVTPDIWEQLQIMSNTEWTII